MRRVAFYDYQPENTFRGLDLRINKLDYDDEYDMSSEERQTYLDDEDQIRHSTIPFKRLKDPSNGHAVPFVTGHRYYIHWASGIDFTNF